MTTMIPRRALSKINCSEINGSIARNQSHRSLAQCDFGSSAWWRLAHSSSIIASRSKISPLALKVVFREHKSYWKIYIFFFIRSFSLIKTILQKSGTKKSDEILSLRGRDFSQNVGESREYYSKVRLSGSHSKPKKFTSSSSLLSSVRGSSVATNFLLSLMEQESGQSEGLHKLMGSLCRRVFHDECAWKFLWAAPCILSFFFHPPPVQTSFTLIKLVGTQKSFRLEFRRIQGKYITVKKLFLKHQRGYIKGISDLARILGSRG